MAASVNSVDLRILIILLLLSFECLSLSYENGKTYKYTYETDILFNELNVERKVDTAQRDVGFTLRAELDLTPIFQAGDTQLVRIRITSASVTSVSRSEIEKNLRALLKFPIYFELSNGIIGKIYEAEAESVFCTNLKKGIISLFQMQDTNGERNELDVSGECDVFYSVADNTVTKIKKNCKNLEIAGQHQTANKMFGVTVATSAKFKYQIGDGIIQVATGIHSNVAVLNLRASLNSAVTSTQNLKLVSSSEVSNIITAGSIEKAMQSINSDSGYSHSDMLLPSGPEIKHCTENCEKPIDVLVKLKDSLLNEKLATVESGQAFLKLVKTFRNAGKTTIEEVLTNPESYYIVPQLIDVAAATQTPAAHNALKALITFDDENAIDYPERQLFAQAFSTHPEDYHIQELMKLMEKKVPNEFLRESVVLALGALVHTYCQQSKQHCQHEVISSYKTKVTEEYRACQEESCKCIYLRSMGNAGLSDFSAFLVQAAEESESSAVSITAIKSLRRIPSSSISKQALSSLQRIFHQNNRYYDTSVRIAAFEILLQNNPSVMNLRNIILSSLHNQKDFELSTFVLRRLKDVAKNNENVRSTLATVLADTRLNNYNVFSQKGKSSAFSSYLAVTKDTNSTYGLYMENSRSGVMKRSAMDVNLESKLINQPLLTVGLYAEGLEALIGDDQGSSDQSTEAQEPTAGIYLHLVDILLRPVEFFRGSSGLMSAVWNAPSDPVSALQGNLLLHDHSQKLHLSNGLIVDLQVLGTASIDLSGSISISLWYKNSKSLVKSSGALVVQSTMKLDSTELQAGISYSAESSSAIDFSTDVDFYEMPFKMCLQMKRPPVTFRHTVEKYEKSKGLKKGYQSKIKRSTTTSAVSYLINQKNSEQCKIVITDEE